MEWDTSGVIKMTIKNKSDMLKEFQNNPIIKKTEFYCAHGTTSVYEHSMNVAALALHISKPFKTSDKQDLVMGALLHDFYLYDWHELGRMNEYRKMHHKHGTLAKENALKYFDLSPKAQNVIESHMWPMNFKKRPKSKEAVFVNIADKICALLETTEGFYHKTKFLYKKKRIRRTKMFS